jgi:hypothetical protein
MVFMKARNSMASKENGDMTYFTHRAEDAVRDRDDWYVIVYIARFYNLLQPTLI